MRTRTELGPLVTVARWTAGTAMIELVVLRVATRTLIHIPGLGRFEAVVRVVSEIGRFAYYLTVVLLLGLLPLLTWGAFRRGSACGRWLAAGLVLVVVSATAGFVGVVDVPELGWMTLVSVVTLGIGVSMRGPRTFPLLLLVTAFVLAGLTSILQGWGGRLTEETFVGLLTGAEVTAMAGWLSMPLLLSRLPSKTAWLTGVGAALVAATGLMMATSTSTILVLWSFGLPVGLSPVIYGVAAGAAVMTLVESDRVAGPGIGTGLLMLVAGGIGMTSTFQTVLVAVGLSLVALGMPPTPKIGDVETREPPSPTRAVEGNPV